MKKLFGHGLALGGVVAAVSVAILLNVLGARHYKRWDVTKGQRYTLSRATTETLHELADPVEIWVVLGSSDPLEQSVKQLLESYKSETSKLEIHYVDPDRDSVALVDLQHRFHLEAERTEDGRIATDAVVIVAHGEKRSFLTAMEMFEVQSGDDPRAKPHEEQAITGAIRAVMRSGAKVNVCFTTGHLELGTKPDQRGNWIGDLGTMLERDLYKLTQVDTTAPDAHEPFKGCDVVVLAFPKEPISKEEESRLKTYLLQGGSALVAVGPIQADTPTGLAPPGLDEALAPFGIGMDERLIIAEPEAAVPDRNGAEFWLTAKQHPVTDSLVVQGPAHHPPRIRFILSRPLVHVTKDGAPSASDLLVTSDKTYAVPSMKGASAWHEAPPKQTDDPAGPFVVAMASERPKVSPSAPHGPRLVVIGSGYALHQQNWREPREQHGAAYVVESAISWLASRPAVLDIPDRPPIAAGIRISEGDRDEVRNYVLIYMPLAVALLGVAVWLRRRSTEGAPLKKKKTKAT